MIIIKIDNICVMYSGFWNKKRKTDVNNWITLGWKKKNKIKQVFMTVWLCITFSRFFGWLGQTTRKEFKQRTQNHF